MRVTLYRSVTDVATNDSADLEWTSFARLLTRHDLRPAKDGPGFSPALFQEGSKRTDDGVVSLSALILDVDKTIEGKAIDEAGALEALQRIRASGVAFVWHTTHSHAPPEKASLRVAIRLSRDVPASEWRAFYKSAADSLGVAYEKKCVNPGRFWYLPSASRRDHAESGSFEGHALDVDGVLAGVGQAVDHEPARAPSDAPSEFGPADGATLAEVQRFLANHGPAITGSGADHHTYRAAAIAMNDFALTEREALSVLTVWNADNVPPWDEAGLLEKLEHSSRYAQNERGGARRAFQDQREMVAAVSKPKSDADEEEPAPGSWAALLAQAKADVLAVLANTPKDGTPAPLFRSSTLLLGEPDVATPWRVQGFMTKGGTTMLAGGPKSSKTWMELEVCIACATGTKAFDQFEVPEAIDVAIFLAEDDATAYKTRVRALVAGRPGALSVEASTARIYVQPRGRSLDLLKVDDLALIVASCRATGKDFKLVSLDPLRDIHSGEEDKSDAMSVVMRHARAVGEVLGAGVLLVHHMGKPSESGNKRSGGQKMRGSGAIHGSVDSGIYIHDTKGDGIKRFSSKVESQVKHGRSAGFFDLTLTIEDDADGRATKAVWVYTKGKAEEKEPDDEADKLADADMDSRVLAALAGGLHSYSITKLHSILGGRKPPITASLTRLEERKLAHQCAYDEEGRFVKSENLRKWKLGAESDRSIVPKE